MNALLSLIGSLLIPGGLIICIICVLMGNTILGVFLLALFMFVGSLAIYAGTPKKYGDRD